MQALQLQTIKAINSVTQQDWEGYCRHVAKLEEQYWEKDCIVEGIIDDFIINTGDDSNKEEEFHIVGSSDSEDNEMSVESDMSCLAEPL
jgi:hypothetical protein